MVRGFFSRWKAGILSSSPLQLVFAKLVGVVGQIVGLCLAGVYLFVIGFGFFWLFMLFTIFLSCVELVSTYKQYKSLKEWS